LDSARLSYLGVSIGRSGAMQPAQASPRVDRGKGEGFGYVNSRCCVGVRSTQINDRGPLLLLRLSGTYDLHDISLVSSRAGL
jgi:hypothetical protein